MYWNWVCDAALPLRGQLKPGVEVEHHAELCNMVDHYQLLAGSEICSCCSSSFNEPRIDQGGYRIAKAGEYCSFSRYRLNVPPNSPPGILPHRSTAAG